MGLIQNVTQWIYKKETVAAATYTSDWKNAEVLNGGQFFLTYDNAVNTTLSIDLSPADANGYGPVVPGDAYERFEVLANADNGSEGFCNPATPAPFDRPFKSYRTVLVVAAEIENCCFALCANGVQ